jgi:fructose-1-phosphate kinase PfkB-like protein
VSRALARLGVASTVTGFVGRDACDWFARDLRQVDGACITPRLLALDGPTRENITLLARDTDPPTDLHVREAGFDVGRDDVGRLTALLDGVAHGGDVVVFSGSRPPGVSGEDLVAWMAPLVGRNVRVVLDADGPTLRRVLFEAGVDGVGPWLIKPNAAELAECLHTEVAADLPTLARQAGVLADRATWIAATAGARGAVLVGGGGIWAGRLAAPVRDAHRSVVNTVGCGDCFLAGLLAAMCDDPHQPAAALCLALAVAAANTVTPGAADFDASLAAVLRQRADVQPMNRPDTAI